MNEIRRIPEVAALDSAQEIIRISPELDIPITPRVRRLIDTAVFHRLSRISQLGLVSLVYPAATHSRFEHSLGVYRQALLFLRQLSSHARFRERVSSQSAELFIVGALIHDLGHWPFCHLMEDMKLDSVPRHEEFVSEYLDAGELPDLLRQDWSLEPEDIESLLSGEARDAETRILSSMLSGPIDIDKMDYLARDSLHAGVPYGRQFDQNRLISSLCLNAAGDGLAINEKGKTAAELMVFARYVMFSEVYWHHGVRAATAMLQRAFYDIHGQLDLPALFKLGESQFIDRLLQAGEGSHPESAAAGELLMGLFGPRRQLYKRVTQYSYFENQELYQLIAHRPYPWLETFAERIAEHIRESTGLDIKPHHVLIDAPPVHKEVEFLLEVRFKPDNYRRLEEVSPVVRALAREQFDDYVKRVRIFAHADIALDLRERIDFDQLIPLAAAEV